MSRYNYGEEVFYAGEERKTPCQQQTRASNCPSRKKVKVDYVMNPPGSKLTVEGCPSGCPIPVRKVGGNVMNCAPAGCLAAGDAPVMVFAANAQRDMVIVTNSPTSQGILWIKPDGAKAGEGGIAIHPGQKCDLPYTGPVAVCATQGMVTYSATEISYA